MDNNNRIMAVAALEADHTRLTTSPLSLSESGDTPSIHLKRLLDIEAILKLKKQTPIEFSTPIINRFDESVFYPNTINMIQGQTGTHKSRLVESILGAVLRKPSCTNELLGFQACKFRELAVVYIDWRSAG